jgi:phenylalanyl-tRNA synthetase beta chain
MEIKKAKIRGVESAGMICSEAELGISQDHSGIWVLDEDIAIGAPLVEALDLNDYILTFELTPNRADSMSAIGVARDLAALALTSVQYPASEIRKSKRKAADEIKVRIDDPEGCPRYAARVIRDVKVGESPWWIKKKLITCGVRPISNVVDITNLVMMECGHPLHAFDLDRFGSDEVVVRRAAEKEKFTTLDGVEHELTPDVLLITNGKEPVAVGGVMGGLDSEVSDKTTNILLEAAYFNPIVIRRGRKLLEMISESSTRFEKGADPNGIEYAINRAACLFQEICGGEVSDGIVDCYPNKIERRSIDFRPERCDAILGITLPPDRIRSIFKYLEFAVDGSSPMKVTVPTFRPDIEREIDLIEEAGRIEGYDAIPDSVENIGPLFTPTKAIDIFKREARAILTGAGFDEMLDHGLADSQQAELMNPGMPLVRLVNPISKDLNVMRNSLAPSALRVAAHNLAHRNMDLSLFELGKTYSPPTDSEDWKEEQWLSLTVTGQTEAGWRDKPRALDFYDLRGAIDRLTEHFGSPEPVYQKINCSYHDPEISFGIFINGVEVGKIGLINPAVARRFDIKQEIYLAELSIDALMKCHKALKEFEELPVYPAAPRDLAILLDESTQAAQVTEVVQQAAGKLAESVRIFDLYQGKQIQSGKKSLAVSISYRSNDRNLESEEVDRCQQKVVERLKSAFDAEIRDR